MLGRAAVARKQEVNRKTPPTQETLLVRGRWEGKELPLERAIGETVPC